MNEEHWDTLLEALAAALKTLPRKPAMKLVKVIDTLPNEPMRELELNIVETIYNAANEALR